MYFRNEDRLDRSTVKNLIGRSQSIKMTVRPEGSKNDIQRAVSFRTRTDGPTSPTISLPRATNFRQVRLNFFYSYVSKHFNIINKKRLKN